MYSIAFHYITLYSIAFHYIALYYITLHYIKSYNVTATVTNLHVVLRVIYMMLSRMSPHAITWP